MSSRNYRKTETTKDTENTKKLSGLPKGWSWVKLGDVINRMTNGCSARQFKEPGDYPITRIETISYGEINLNRVRYVNDVSEKDIDKYKLEFNDILFSHINSDYHLGKTAIFKKKDQTVLHGINLLLLRANTDIILPELLNYLFNFYRIKGEFFKIAQHAVNQSSINQKKLKNLDIPLPPLPEQHRIVEKIEELFSELDNGIENLKKAKAQIKTYRQAVLKSAFEGRLTTKNTQKLSDLSALSGLPEGWEWVKLGEELEVKDGTHDTPKYIEDGIPFITQKNIKYGQFVFDNYKMISQEDHDKFYRRSNVKLNDIIISMIGANRGMSAIVKTKKIFSIKNVGLVKTDENKFLAKYLDYFFKSKIGQKSILSSSKGGAQQFIGLTELRNWLVPKIDIAVQTQIVEEIEKRFSVADKMEAAIDESLKKAEALRQSILKQAFEGKLV